MIRVSGCLLLLSYNHYQTRVQLYCSGELVTVLCSPQYLNANQTCMVPIKQQVYHTCIRCRLLSHFLNKVFFVRSKSISIPFGEHVCMYFSVHTGACTICPFSAYTQRADHENFRGFCVNNVGLCREMVSSLKFNVWFQGHRMMNTTF